MINNHKVDNIYNFTTFFNMPNSKLALICDTVQRIIYRANYNMVVKTFLAPYCNFKANHLY